MWALYLRDHRPSLVRLYIVLLTISIFMVLLVGAGSDLFDMAWFAVSPVTIFHLRVLIEL